MKEMTLSQAEVLTSPNPFALIVSKKEDGKANLMAVSWWTYVSNHPPMVVASLSNKGLSGGCISAQGVFTLCVPDSWADGGQSRQSKYPLDGMRRELSSGSGEQPVDSALSPSADGTCWGSHPLHCPGGEGLW